MSVQSKISVAADDGSDQGVGCVPVPGMKVVPDYYGTDEWTILFGGFWISLCNFAIGQTEARAAFKADTGLDIAALLPRSPLDAMIDEATGFKAEMLARWCDWVTLTQWNGEAHNIAPVRTKEAR